MNRIKFLNAIFIGMCVYVILSVFLGKQGVWAYNQLHDYKILIAENVEDLQDINEGLTIDKKTLSLDDDAIEAYAHSMGFIKDDENLVKITGIKSYSNKVYDSGVKVTTPLIIFMPDWIAKGIGFAVFLLINLINSLISLVIISSSPSRKMVLHTATITTGEINDSKKI
jgi:cell division protein FtsB